MPFAPASSSKSSVICRGKRVCDIFLQVCPICALGAHLLFRRIAIAAGEPRARPKRLQRVTRPSARVWRRDPRRHAARAGVLPPTPHTPFARSDSPRPTLCSLCRRTMRGRIFESKNMAHIDVDSGSSACDPPADQGRAREALARARGSSVHSGGARRAWRKGAAGHVFGQRCACGAAQAICLACYVMYDVCGSRPSRNVGRRT